MHRSVACYDHWILLIRTANALIAWQVKQKEHAWCPFHGQQENKMLLSFCSDIPTSESRLGSCRWQLKSPGGTTVSDAKRHRRDMPVTSEASTCSSKYSIYCFVTNNRLWQALTTQFVSCSVVLYFCCLLQAFRPSQLTLETRIGNCYKYCIYLQRGFISAIHSAMRNEWKHCHDEKDQVFLVMLQNHF